MSILEKSFPHMPHSSLSVFISTWSSPSLFFFWIFCLFSLYWMTSSNPKFSNRALAALPLAPDTIRGGGINGSENFDFLTWFSFPPSLNASPFSIFDLFSCFSSCSSASRETWTSETDTVLDSVLGLWFWICWFFWDWD